ncbi:MAG: phospholipase D family protein [Pseudomonadales bacterium]
MNQKLWNPATIAALVPIGLFLLASVSTWAQGTSALPAWLNTYCPDCAAKSHQKTGVYILESGEDALLARAWLAERAQRTIDVQYFIWGTDNIGILAAEALLAAADRGVHVRVLVDDFLLEAENRVLASLNHHPNVELRIYNPTHHVGVSILERLFYLFSDFKNFNQRMHDKVAIFDDRISITGGRNMADEYFDYDAVYNFRDRDILLAGAVNVKVKENFDEFWDSSLALPLERLLDVPDTEAGQHIRIELRAYANDPANFDPKMRQRIADVSPRIRDIVADMVWTDVEFIDDSPGKTKAASDQKTYGRLIAEVAGARQLILIQTPYLIFPEDGIALLAKKVAEGVRVKIVTNSMLSTDNPMAFSGYQQQRKSMLQAGIELYEFRHDAAVRHEIIAQTPTNAGAAISLHAKSMVVDQSRLFIGSFNLDPRSAQLNTEVGVLIENPVLAQALTQQIENDMLSVNSWAVSHDFNPDHMASWLKNVEVWFYGLLPIKSLL